jgi:hypothetical protein
MWDTPSHTTHRLAGGAAAAAAGQQQQTTWLADVLHPVDAPSSGVAATAQHYAEMVLEKVSLPIVKDDGCDCVDAVNPCNSKVFR